MTTIRSAFGVPSIVHSNSFIAGIECEIEDIQQCGEVDTDFWNIVEDGSLRNSGKEFISPARDKNTLLTRFKALHNSIEYKTEHEHVRFSPRTSIHVHVNCLDLEEKEVHSIVMWYVLFEPIFFLLVDPARQHNIHCVQLNQTILSESYKRPIKTLHQKWSKYTALNILPLSRYGTIEFRHMHGTDNVEELTGWLNALENLWNFGRSTKMFSGTISSQEKINDAFLGVFKDTPEALKYFPILPTLLGNSLIDVKLSLI